MTPNILSWTDRISDHLNPILVKETRQALKSRQFVVTFMLLLLVSWLISALGILLAGGSLDYGSPSRGFLLAYVYVLEFAVLLVVPFSAFRSMLTEREHNTYELLSISTLRPRQIVWGKLCSSVVQMFLYYSAIAPFVAFTSLLPGFDFSISLFLLAVILLWSVFVCMICLMLSTISNQRHWQTINMLGMLMLLVIQLFSSFGIATTIMVEGVAFDDTDFRWGMLWMCLAAASYFWLTQEIAVSQLTFESDNRSSRIRIVCSVQYLALWAVILGYVYQTHGTLSAATMATHPIGADLMYFAITVSGIHWSVVGLFSCTELDFLSRRIRRGLPRSALFRLLTAPWYPGGSRGLLYLLAHLLPMPLVVSVLDGWTGRLTVYAAGMSLYVLVYIFLGVAIGRWIQTLTPQVRPAHVRVLIVLMIAMGAIAPLIPPAIGLTRWTYEFTLENVTNPFSALSYLADNGDEPLSRIVVNVLAAGGLLALVLNARAMLRGMSEIVMYTPQSTQKLAASPRVETMTKTSSGDAPGAQP